MVFNLKRHFNKRRISSLVGQTSFFIWDLDETMFFSEDCIIESRKTFLNFFLDRGGKESDFIKGEQEGYRWFEIVSHNLGISFVEAMKALDSLEKELFVKRNDELINFFKKSQHEHILMTNSSQKSTLRVLEKILDNNYRDFFSDIFCIEDFIEPKPNKHFLNKIVKTRNKSASEFVFIGNSWRDDLEPAKSLGMKTILVGGKNNNVDLEATDLEELLRLLK